MTITGQQIRDAREAKGMSRSQMADLIGGHHVSIRHVEDNEAMTETRNKLIEYLGLTDEILANRDVKNKRSTTHGKIHREVEMEVLDPPEPIHNSPSLDSGEHHEDEVPLISAAEIVGNTSDSGIPVASTEVFFPGSLVKVAREQRLTINQMIALIKIEDILAEAGNYGAGGVSESGWLDLFTRLKGEWL